MANFHFFTDVDRIDRTAEGVGAERRHLPFGPLSPLTGATINKYNVSSMHFAKTAVGGITQRPSAYAVCNGSIIFRSIRQLSGSSMVDTGLVDIILKPSVQSEVNPRIKYFVYKSVLLQSIATLSGSTWNFINNGTNGFSAQWVNNLIASASVAGSPVPAPIIGSSTGLNDIFGITASDTSYLDDLFGGNLSFSVTAGDEIGRFANKGDNGTFADNSYCVFGFEILLDNYGFHPTLGDVGTVRGHRNYSAIDGFDGYEDAMSKAHIFDFTGSGLSHTTADFTSNPSERFIYENSKEAILNYMDPAAYFGNFARQSVNERDTLTLHRKGVFAGPIGGAAAGTATLTIPLPTSTTSQKRLISDYLLFPLASNSSDRIFSNFNKTYVDLRDQYGNSHNYFHRYGELANEIKDLRISFSSTSSIRTEISSKQKYADGSMIRSYPLVELESHFDNVAATTATPETNLLSCSLGFRLHGDDLNTSVKRAKYDVYADTAVSVTSLPASSTAARGNLDLNPNSKFFSLRLDTTEYTSPINFGLTHIVDNNEEILLAQYVRLYIIRHETAINDNPPPTPSANVNDTYYTDNIHATKIQELKNYEYLDNLWMPFQRTERIPSGSTLSGIFTSLNSRYWNNVQGDGSDYMADIGEAIDNSGIRFRTLFANAHRSRRMNFRADRTATPAVVNSISSIPNDLPLFSGIGSGNLYNRLEQTINLPSQPKIIDISSITDTLPASDPGKAQIADASRQFSSIFSVRQQPPAQGLSAFTTGFTGITFTSAQWFQLWNIYNANFTGANSLTGFKTYLGFVHDGVDTDGANNEYVRFKVVIRGFKKHPSENRIILQEFDSAGSSGPVYHYIFYPSYDVRANLDLIGLASASQLGSSHVMRDHQSLGNNFVTIKTVESNMLFARGINMPWKDLVEMKKYVSGNIEQVFDTDNNVGTWEIYNTNGINDQPAGIPPFTGSVNLSQDDPYQVGADIKIDLAVPSDYYRINPAQSVISVIKSIATRRAFVTSRRTGVFYCSYPNVGTANAANRSKVQLAATLGNTAAHEFGHLIGLVDRYCYRARVSLNTGPKLVYPSGHQDPAPALYIPENIDPLYHNRYRWQFNLMNNRGDGVPDNLNNVQYFRDAAGNLEPNFSNEYLTYAAFTASQLYKHATFITKKQWDHIQAYENENAIFGSLHLFFKSIGTNAPVPANSFNGSFIGWRNASVTSVANDNDLVGEDNFIAPANFSYHKMSQRIDSATRYWGWIFSNSIVGLSGADPQDLTSGGLATVRWLITERWIPEGFYDLRPAISTTTQGNEDFYDLSEGSLSDTEFGPVAQNPAGSASIDNTQPIINRGADLWEEASPANITTTVNRIYHDHPNRTIIANILADPNQI